MTSLFYPPKYDSGLAGAKLYFTQTGTSTPQDTYTDEDLQIAHANPVTADGSGVFAPIYLDPSLPSYRVRLTTAAGVQIYLVDDYPIGGPAAFSYGAYAKKLNQSTVESSTVLDDDPDLQVRLETGYHYVVEGQIGFRAGTVGQGAMGAKFALAYSGVLNTGNYANICQFVNGTGAVALSPMDTTVPKTYATIGDTVFSNQIRFTQYFRVTTLGTLSLQFAQNSSNSASLIIEAGSWLRAHRIGTNIS